MSATTSRSREAERFARQLSKASMFPSMNPTMAAAAASIEPVHDAERMETIAQMEGAARDERMEALIEDLARKKEFEAAHAQRMKDQEDALRTMVAVAKDRVASNRLKADLARIERSQVPVEMDLVQSLGLSPPMTGVGDNTNLPDTPMEGVMSGKMSNVRDAGLVGYAEDDGPLVERYLETTDPTGMDRGLRGLGGAWLGGLGGLGLGAGVQRVGSELSQMNVTPARWGGLVPGTSTPKHGLRAAQIGAILKSPRARAIGALGGALTGGALGALSNMGVDRSYDTSTGEETGLLDRLRAQEVFDALDPGAQPGNFGIGDGSTLSPLLTSPQMAYGADIDEAMNEDPITAMAGIKTSQATPAAPPPRESLLGSLSRIRFGG